MKRIILSMMLLMPGLLMPQQPLAKADTPVIAVQPPMMDIRHIALGNFFTKYNCPLLPYVDDFIAAADKSGIDWRLLPAISLHESTCGKRYPTYTNNPFGWLERQGTVAKFTSISAAISFITERLANNSPYVGKTIRQKLATYCPTPGYPEQTINYMNQIK